MTIILHPHARERMEERGATRKEVTETVRNGERFTAKFGRHGFRKNFIFDGLWQVRRYRTKQIEVYAATQGNNIVIVTILVKYFIATEKI